MTTHVHIGSGAGFAGDRFDAAIPVVNTLMHHNGPCYLIYEVMGERTLAIAQNIKRQNPLAGYSPWLEIYLPEILKKCIDHQIRIVANFGNANPEAAALRTLQIATDLGIAGLRVGVVLGDDLLEYTDASTILSATLIEGTDFGSDDLQLHAANAYLGAQPIADALALGVDVVLVGRTTDAALVLGPLLHEFQWSADDYDKLACGTVAGHLLECGGQITGGYFADPGWKDVPDLHHLGYPIVEINNQGEIVVTKADGTGGIVSKATVTEQLLYEVHDPAAYLTPDVTVDITAIELAECAPNRISVTGARGRPPPDTMKVTVSYDGGWMAEAEISYAGINALARARLAADTVKLRLRALAIHEICRIELIGTGAVHDNDQAERFEQSFASGDFSMNGEFRVRVAIRSWSKNTAQRAADEVLALYCCGPAGGGGVRQSITEQMSTASVLIDRQQIEQHVRAVEVFA